MKCKFLSALFLLLFYCVSMNAQIGKWIIPAQYDKIRIDNVTNLIYGTLLDSTLVWNSDGHLLIKTNNKMYQFRENRAVEVKPGTASITGFYYIDGTPIQLNQQHSVEIAHSYPYFSNGFLLVQNNGYYRFINGNGEMVHSYYQQAFPFFHKYACCIAYENAAKKKKPYYTYVHESGEEAKLIYQGKVFDKEDVEFQSSISEDGKGIVVIKHKLFFFDAENGAIRPIMASGENAKEEKQVYIDGKMEECYTATSDTTSALMALISKKEIVLFNFDKLLRPTTIAFSDKKITFPKKAEPIAEIRTESNVEQGENGLYGVSVGNTQVFPPQFEDVKQYDGKMVIVKTKGKWGMIKMDDNYSFNIKLNKGKAIGFRHQKHETTIRIDLPPYISSKSTRLLTDEGNGFSIDMTSSESRDTESGNYVQYNCTMDIPTNLPDEVTDMEIPVQVSYEGLLSPMIKVKAKAWYIKYFNIEINDSETTVSNGVVSFSFNLNVEKSQDEEDYPLTVTADAYPSDLYLEKITEMKYKCHVSSLEEGVNDLKVKVHEKGCPESVFPLEIVYSANKGKGKSAGRVQATVRKKIVTSMIEEYQQ